MSTELQTRVWQDKSNLIKHNFQGGYLEAYDDSIVLTFDINNPVKIPYSEIETAHIKVGKLRLKTDTGKYKLYLYDTSRSLAAGTFSNHVLTRGSAAINSLKMMRLTLGTETVSRDIETILKNHGVKLHSRIWWTCKKALIIKDILVLLLILLFIFIIAWEPRSESRELQKSGVLTQGVVVSIDGNDTKPGLFLTYGFFVNGKQYHNENDVEVDQSFINRNPKTVKIIYLPSDPSINYPPDLKDIRTQSSVMPEVIAGGLFILTYGLVIGYTWRSPESLVGVPQPKAI